MDKHIDLVQVELAHPKTFQSEINTKIYIQNANSHKKSNLIIEFISCFEMLFFTMFFQITFL